MGIVERWKISSKELRWDSGYTKEGFDPHLIIKEMAEKGGNKNSIDR